MKQIISTLCIIGMVCLMGSCHSAKQATFSNSTLKSQLENKNFKVEFVRAYPQMSQAYSQAFDKLMRGTGQSSQAVNLIGNASFITIKNDSISGILPFYGERYMGGHLNGDGNIRFNGIYENYTQSLKGNYILIACEINDQDNQIEHYKLNMRIYDNGDVDLRIQSSQRSSIRYSGKIESLKED